jgi:hypothetical protein
LPRCSTDLPAHLSRARFKNAFRVGRRIAQGLKPAFLLAHGGTAEQLAEKWDVFLVPSSP